MEQYRVDNTKFLKLMIEFLNQREADSEAPIPNEIAEIFMNMAENYALKNNFRNIPYIDDMKDEAILTCIRYVDKFNPEKSDNPFAYFTSVIHNSFLTVINTEEKHNKIRTEMLNEFINIYGTEIKPLLKSNNDTTYMLPSDEETMEQYNDRKKEKQHYIESKKSRRKKKHKSRGFVGNIL